MPTTQKSASASSTIRVPGTMESWQVIARAMTRRERGWTGQPLPRWLKIHYPAESHERIQRRSQVLDNITPDDVRGYVETYRAKYGSMPHLRSGPVEGQAFGWLTINRAIREGDGRWGGATTLARWLDKQYPQERQIIRKRRVPGLTITAAQVRQWVDAYRGAHDGHFPSLASGGIPGTALTWQSVHSTMSFCLRGWRIQTTLARWLDINYPAERGAQRRHFPAERKASAAPALI